MSTTPYYDSTGSLTLRTADVRENMNEAILASSEFGDAAQLEADKVLAQILDPVADQLGQAYDALQEIIDSRDPEAAEGVHLDNIGSLVGVDRQPATYSTVVLTLTGTPATVIAAGKRARVPGTTDIYWALDDPATIGGGGTVDAAATCSVIGSQEASAAAISEIVDPVSGWTGVTNALAAAVGDEIETDAAYYRSRETQLSAGGTSRAASIRSRLEALDYVTAAACLENVTLATDSNGLPPKSFRPIIWPTGLSTAQEEEIVQTIWLVAGAGIYCDGTERYTITDDQGQWQEFGFEYGAQLEIWAEVNLITTDDYPSTGDADVEAAMKAYDNDYSLGSKVLPDAIITYIRATVPGIDDVDLRIKAGSAPGASDTVPLYPGVDEVPYFDTHVTVNS